MTTISIPSATPTAASAADPRRNLVGLPAKVADADPSLPVHDLYDEVGARLYDQIGWGGYDTATPVRFARSLGGPVLDLACGSGRIGLAIAQRGLPVTGLDLSPDMLARYRERLADEPSEVAARSRLVQGDLHTFELDERFVFAVLGATTIVLVEPSRRRQFFERVHDHLQPGGHFALDFFQLDLEALRRQPEAERVIDVPVGAGGVGFAVVCQEFDLLRRQERVAFLVEQVAGPSEVTRFVVTTAKALLLREEVEADLVASGFELVEEHGASDSGRGTPGSFEWLIGRAVGR